MRKGSLVQCPQCQATQADSARFCTACGTRLQVPARPRWEYRQLYTPEGVDSEGTESPGSLLMRCTELGAEGWELVAVLPTRAGNTRWVFKRPVA